MPYADVNGVQIYYEAFGQDQPGLPPVVLIHGSTTTGELEWKEIAPRLAMTYRVLVPDCRGHGRSEGTHTYTFREMAGDTAAFIRKMGGDRAHVIGHSNGGNIALVSLMEHPEVIQSAVLQAANAFVTPYLIEREPVVLAPDHFARNNPEQVRQMIAAHGPRHGEGYWRELLAITLKETISEPNYSSVELGQVRRPVFVIMGAEDQVNAPDRQAQFIAGNLPGAELWMPEGTGHHVHRERPEEWIEKVLDFLRRRGQG